MRRSQLPRQDRTSHSPRQFAEAARAHAGPDSVEHLVIGPGFHCPAEVDTLPVDSARAHAKPGRQPVTGLGAPVGEMTAAALQRHPDTQDRPATVDTEHRLDELEIRLAFAADALEQMNAVLVRQQNLIELLTREVMALKADAEGLSLSPPRKPEEEIPPHY